MRILMPEMIWQMLWTKVSGWVRRSCYDVHYIVSSCYSKIWTCYFVTHDVCKIWISSNHPILYRHSNFQYGRRCHAHEIAHIYQVLNLYWIRYISFPLNIVSLIPTFNNMFWCLMPISNQIGQPLFGLFGSVLLFQ